MKGSLGLHLGCWSLAVAAALACGSAAAAETIPVRHMEGTLHAFLEMRNQQGRVIAAGDAYQTAEGDRVTAYVVFQFKDGSVDDETTVFSQHGSFQLISDHHIQKGPSFKQPLDMTIDAAKGQVTVRTQGKDGKPEEKSEQMNLPPDLANGLVMFIAKNLAAGAAETKVPMLVATPKPRLVQLAISPRDEQSFALVGFSRKAQRYEVKIDLGGVAGVVAPMVGKQPANLQIWVSSGPAPEAIRESGQFFEGGPIWTIQLASPVWPAKPRPGS
jgi:hypothetical protein